jgi:hypothetical protein
MNSRASCRGICDLVPTSHDGLMQCSKSLYWIGGMKMKVVRSINVVQALDPSQRKTQPPKRPGSSITPFAYAVLVLPQSTISRGTV